MISRQLELRTSHQQHRPYLETVHSSPRCTLAALEWARYLGAAFGARGALEALRYYHDLGWISESVWASMVQHLEGLSLSELQPQGTASDSNSSFASLAESPFSPHLGSLWHIARVAGDDIDTILEETHFLVGEFAPQSTSQRRFRWFESGGVPT
ncbi:flagella protein [Halogranum rubrum]|uniref:Flagella protein n=1 Tax=Halogranum rubrum TaxID=553466 RepID=A0A1I4F3Y9_9EURY|nr:flagella protein [Halogranum rubrum]